MVTDRGRRWPWITLLVVVALVVAAVTAWLVTRPQAKSPEAAARDDLKSAQLALINAPGMHYTGQLSGKDGKSAGLDLRVTNGGVTSGTIDYGSGKTLTYLSVGGKTFMRGGKDAWIAHGLTAEAAEQVGNEVLLRPATVLDVDVAAKLKPESLGRRLGPGPGQSDPVLLAAAALIDGHSVDGVTSGSVTTYLVSGRARRITDPNLDLTPTPMTADEVAQFYRELRPEVTALDNAGDTEASVTAEFAPGSDRCVLFCFESITVTSTPTPFATVNIPGVTPPGDDIVVAYDMAITINGVVAPHPECGGVLQMPGRGTATLQCRFDLGPGQHAHTDLTLRPVLGRTRADALVAALDTAAKQSGDRAKCTFTSLSEAATPRC